MKLPLLVSRVPSVGRGPTVMLARGDWKLESNHKDSELMITLASGDSIPFANHLVLPSHMPIAITVNKQGTEQELTIYAIKQ